MKVIGKPWKKLPWQVTLMENDSGKELIQIKCYFRHSSGRGYDFKKYFVIYCLPNDWKTFKKEIAKNVKEKAK